MLTSRPLAGRWEDEFSVIYRACAQVGLADPRAVDELRIWEVASILGANEEPDLDTWPKDAPSIYVVRRIVALNEGRKEPGIDEPIDSIEFARLLAEVQGGKRAVR